MREIKFRVWDLVDKKMRDAVAFPAGFLNDNEAFIPMQYTGLQDKNGVEIYEGDVVAFPDTMTADNTFGTDPNGFIYDETVRHEVVFDEEWAGFSPRFDEDDHWKYKRDTHYLFTHGEIEVIGNIYENRDLLE